MELTLFAERVNAGSNGPQYLLTVVVFSTDDEDSVSFQVAGHDSANGTTKIFETNFLTADVQGLRISAMNISAEGRFALCVMAGFGAAVLGEIYRIWTNSTAQNPGLSGRARWQDVIGRLQQSGGNLASAAAQAAITCSVP